MADFVEFTEHKGDKVLVNIEHIIKIQPDEEGTYLYFDTTIGNQNSMSPSILHVEKSYTAVKRKLQQ